MRIFGCEFDENDLENVWITALPDEKVQLLMAFVDAPCTNLPDQADYIVSEMSPHERDTFEEWCRQMAFAVRRVRDAKRQGG